MTVVGNKTLGNDETMRSNKTIGGSTFPVKCYSLGLRDEQGQPLALPTSQRNYCLKFQGSIHRH